MLTIETRVRIAEQGGRAQTNETQDQQKVATDEEGEATMKWFPVKLTGQKIALEEDVEAEEAFKKYRDELEEGEVREAIEETGTRVGQTNERKK